MRVALTAAILRGLLPFSRHACYYSRRAVVPAPPDDVNRRGRNGLTMDVPRPRRTSGGNAMAALIIAAGPHEGSYFPLGKRTTVIGRQETCAIQIVDDRVSRKHVQIHFEEKAGEFRVLDMNSGNGTTVNGNKISSETPLRDFDSIRIGDTTLCFISADFPDQQSALNHFKQHGHRLKTTVENG